MVALVAIGVAIVAVLVSTGLTVGLSLEGDLIVRIGAGVGTPLVLVGILKVLVARTGLLIQFAFWLTQREEFLGGSPGAGTGQQSEE